MLRKRSVTIRGHRTSFSVEDDFFEELRNLARGSNISLPALVARIDCARQPDQNLSSAIRLYVLDQLRARINGSRTASAD
jgi:predicted DNA-binding ribbon-helix-helix protein